MQVTQAHVDAALAAPRRGQLTPEDAAIAKWWATESQGRIVDACLQLHGGYGYMLEYPIARAYADARVNRIYGGANEIMLEIVGRSLGLGEPRSSSRDQRTAPVTEVVSPPRGKRSSPRVGQLERSTVTVTGDRMVGRGRSTTPIDGRGSPALRGRFVAAGEGVRYETVAGRQ